MPCGQNQYNLYYQLDEKSEGIAYIEKILFRRMSFIDFQRLSENQ